VREKERFFLSSFAETVRVLRKRDFFLLFFYWKTKRKKRERWESKKRAFAFYSVEREQQREGEFLIFVRERERVASPFKGTSMARISWIKTDPRAGLLTWAGGDGDICTEGRRRERGWGLHLVHIHGWNSRLDSKLARGGELLQRKRRELSVQGAASGCRTVQMNWSF
jgi:hypothetical protein